MRYLNTIRDANEGRNSAFTLRIGRLPTQGTNAAVVFDDYSLFSVSTEHGNMIAVFDNTRQQWVCFDDIGDDNPILQFAVADQSENPVLYAITENKLYRLYAAEHYLQSTVTLRTNIAGRTNLILTNATVVLVGAALERETTVTEIVDGVEARALVHTTSSDNIDNLYYNFQNLSKQGWKVGLKIAWSDASELVLVGASFNLINPQTPYRNQARR
jgi:hypothetical protein